VVAGHGDREVGKPVSRRRDKKRERERKARIRAENSMPRPKTISCEERRQRIDATFWSFVPATLQPHSVPIYPPRWASNPGDFDAALRRALVEITKGQTPS
jgi:hypothetical protein